MKLVTYDTPAGRHWGLLEGGTIAAISEAAGAPPTLRSALEKPDAAALIARLAKAAPRRALADVALAPVLPDPDKILCVGLNYEMHRKETGRDEVQHPTIFTRFANSQVGHGQPMIGRRPRRISDYEGELAIVMGKPGRHIAKADAYATSRATPATTTAPSATGSATPSSSRRARTSSAPAPSGHIW